MISLSRRHCLKCALGISLLPLSRVGRASFVVFEAEGIGEDLSSAKAQALSMLSQQILAEVKTEVSQTVEDRDGQLSRFAKTARQVHSHVLLKGVRYRVLEQTPGHVRVVAMMDEEAVAQTVRYLQAATAFKPESLSLAAVPRLQEKARMLQAILLALPKSLQAKYQKDLTEVEQKLRWLELRQTHALWVLNLQGKPVTLHIDGRRISTQAPIFLPPGRHDYRIESEGYQPVEGILQVHAGQRIEQTVDWIPERVAMPIALEVSPKLAFISEAQWQDWLATLGFVLALKAAVTLKVDMQDQVVRVDEFVRHQVQLSLAFYKGQRRLKRLRTQLQVTSYANDTQMLQQAVGRRLEKALRVLVSKTDFEG